MSHLSLMNHTAIQIFIAKNIKTYHNYAYLLKHTRTLTNNKCRIARSQNTNSHTHLHYNHKNILQLHTHDQNKHGTPTKNIPTPHATNNTQSRNPYQNKNQGDFYRTYLYTEPPKRPEQGRQRQTYQSCIFYLFLYTYQQKNVRHTDGETIRRPYLNPTEEAYWRKLIIKFLVEAVGHIIATGR